MIGYHVTSQTNLASILRNGLQPVIGLRSMAQGETTPSVYFFPSEEACEDGLMGWLGEQLEDEAEVVILRVDLAGLNARSDVEWEIAVMQPVSPERILAVLDETLALDEQASSRHHADGRQTNKA